jgi:hypothetical protein
MGSNWQDTLGELRIYIQTNSKDICIKPASISIAESVKAGFYALFDRTREAVVSERASQYLAEAEALSQNYIDIEQKLCGIKDGITGANNPLLNPGAFNLDGIALGKPLGEFLHQPMAALRRAVYDPLFSLLQGNLTEEGFGKTVEDKIKTSFNQLYCQGYEKWVGFMLVSQLQADRYFDIGVKGITSSQLVKKKMGNTPLAAGLPAPRETRTLNLDGRPEELRTIVPVDMLVHSAKIQQYVGIKFGFEKAQFDTATANTKRASVPYDTAKTLLNRNAMLVYLSQDTESASLVADNTRFWRPDMVMEFEDKKDWSHDQNVERWRSCLELLEPPLGMFIIPVPGVIGGEAHSLPEGTAIITPGFDASRLAAISGKLAGANV